MISALVDAGASPTAANRKGETAEGVATKRKDRARVRALLPRAQRASKRLPVILMLTGFVLLVVAWANKNVKVAVAGGAFVAAAAIEKRFKLSGVFDSRIPKVRLLLQLYTSFCPCQAPANQVNRDWHAPSR